MSQTLIQLKSVSKHYGTLAAVSHLSLEIGAGRVLALLGASGCGKTTTLRLMAGLEAPDSGEVWLNGRRVAGGRDWIPPEERSVGLVFQDYALFPHLTVEANIAFPLNRMTNKARQTRIQEMLELVGLAGLGKRYPHQLSGGQQQRVALARALAPAPAVLLLDEPFSNLDAALRKSTREDIYRVLQATQTTTVFVTHDQSEAFGLADRIGVMAEGILEQIGTPRDLYDNPATPQLALFLGEANLLKGKAHQDWVETPLGNLPLRRPQQGQVKVYIRPENVILVNPEAGKPAHVERIHYYGSYQDVWVRLLDGTSLHLHLHPSHNLNLQDSIHLAVRDQVVAFPA